MTREKWEDDEIALVTARYNAGASFIEISSLVGRSVVAVRRKTLELGIRKKIRVYWTEEEDKLLLSSWFQPGKNTKKNVAKKLGKSHQSCGRRLKILRGTARQPEFFNTSILLAARYGVTPGTVVGWISKYRIRHTRIGQMYAVSDSGVERLDELNAEWLLPKEHTWSIKFDECQVCGTSKTPHMAHGKCKACHSRHWMRQKYGYKTLKYENL